MTRLLKIDAAVITLTVTTLCSAAYSDSLINALSATQPLANVQLR